MTESQNKIKTIAALKELHLKSNHSTFKQLVTNSCTNSCAKFYSAQRRKNTVRNTHSRIVSCWVSCNQLPGERHQFVTAVDGWYLLSAPDFLFLFSGSWTQCVASHKMPPWLCVVLVVEHEQSVAAVSVQSFTGEHNF